MFSIFLEQSLGLSSPYPDPDPVGSEYYWLSWIRIQVCILYTDLDPNPATYKLTKKTLIII